MKNLDFIHEFIRKKFPEATAGILSGSALEKMDIQFSDIDIILFSNDTATIKGETIIYKSHLFDIIILPEHHVFHLIYDDYYKRLGFFIGFIEKGAVLFERDGFATNLKNYCKELFEKCPPSFTKTELLQLYNNIFTRLEDLGKPSEDNSIYLVIDLIDAIISYLTGIYNTWGGTYRMKHRFLKKHNQEFITGLEKNAHGYLNKEISFNQLQTFIKDQLKQLGMPGTKVEYDGSNVTSKNKDSYYLVFRSNFKLTFFEYHRLILEQFLLIPYCKKTLLPNLNQQIEYDFAIYFSDFENGSFQDIKEKTLQIYKCQENRHLYTIHFAEQLQTPYTLMGKQYEDICVEYFNHLQDDLLENIINNGSSFNEISKIVLGINLFLTHAKACNLSIDALADFSKHLYESWSAKSIDLPFIGSIDNLKMQKKLLDVYLSSIESKLEEAFNLEYSKIISEWGKEDEQDLLSTRLRIILDKLTAGQSDRMFPTSTNIHFYLLWDTMDLFQLDEKKRVAIPYLMTHWIEYCETV